MLATQILQRPNMHPCRPRSVAHLALKCSDIVEHVGLRILLDDSALPQLFIAATDGKAPAIDGPGQVGRAADGR